MCSPKDNSELIISPSRASSDDTNSPPKIKNPSSNIANKEKAIRVISKRSQKLDN